MNIIRRIDVKFAAKVLTTLWSCVVAFHLLVLTVVIPYHLVWGGRLESASQMHLLETVSIIIGIMIIVVVGMKGRLIKPSLPQRVITFLLWLLVILFTLNTIGNLLSKTSLETILFTPITFISVILCYRMATER